MPRAPRTPDPKVVASTSAAAAATLVVSYFFHLPDGVAGALVVLATFAGGWFKRSGRG